MPDSVRPHRGQPTRLPRSWDSPGKNTGVVAISFSSLCLLQPSKSFLAGLSTPTTGLHCLPSMQESLFHSKPSSASHRTQSKSKRPYKLLAEGPAQFALAASPICPLSLSSLCRQVCPISLPAVPETIYQAFFLSGFVHDGIPS